MAAVQWLLLTMFVGIAAQLEAPTRKFHVGLRRPEAYFRAVSSATASRAYTPPRCPYQFDGGNETPHER